MRTIHELLIILRDNVQVEKSFFGLRQRIYSGLCIEVNFLNKVLNPLEEKILHYYINKNKPIYIMPRMCRGNYIEDTFGWRPKLWKPRLEWLNKHIELTS